MKKKFLLTFLIIPISIYSQELDKTYLDSLPESIREDVKKRIDLKEKTEKPVYRRASSFIDKKKLITHF